MLVRDVMQTKLHTVTPVTTLPEALRLTSQRGVRHLPVLDGDRLVGILSDRDLKRAVRALVLDGAVDLYSGHRQLPACGSYHPARLHGHQFFRGDAGEKVAM